MNLSLVEIALLISGFVAAVVTFIHRLKMIVLQKMNKRANKYGHYAVSFLVAGLLEVLFCIALRNGAVTVNVAEGIVKMLMYVSGGTLCIGLWNMVRYYMCV